ncbi:glycoside hydrolase family 130 protein [Akkermansiaceae bacterium]|nr:glycoside hydrolase family 130 protein [Akkermansiaceae bacterium]MDA7929394.1 glycoside hydrolase family 130 protein [Akkermansiaceae bacterium]MDB4466138.1 glycoside hydrolase family 130 protein [bacterium]MDB4509841.1 glycoside hydrolase family 130 protein [Akkermansiaceae bacterium]
MNSIQIRRHEISLLPESARVIIRPFIPGESWRIKGIIERILVLTEEDVTSELNQIKREFESRHKDVETVLLKHFEKITAHLPPKIVLSHERKVLIGALFSGEYALESAALFNPSIVPHPDQSGVPSGGLRFIMSLRATGEGHISSIEFRTGSISPSGAISVDHISRFVNEPEIHPNPSYRKKSFIRKLKEIGFENHHFTAEVLELLHDDFTRTELNESICTVRHDATGPKHELAETLECIQWLADSNYELKFPDTLAISERIIFPVSPNETNGIEDARFVRFVDDNGKVTYYATYTAYNGHTILSQLLETEDFLHFRVSTLNGSAVQNKGMALFPRRIKGRYAMLSRQDDENLFIMFSDDPHYWKDPQLILRPSQVWNSAKIGNCGSPIETEAGWLVMTHGVGPMRKYCIGAVLLDLEDPTKVIGRLSHPILCPEGNEREGYVPNVVYSCGSLVHGKDLILPFAVSDRATAIATVSLDDLLAALMAAE